jgi:hypothetical protein
MTRVRIVKHEPRHAIGDVVNLHFTEAIDLIDRGIAVPVEPEIERAIIDPPLETRNA